MGLANLRGWTNPPYSEDELEELGVDDVRVEVRFGESYIRPLFVIVEMYDHKKNGRGKRLYQQEFTDKERKVISTYYGKLYDWYLRRGIPVNGVAMQPSTLALLQRTANFFASL